MDDIKFDFETAGIEIIRRVVISQTNKELEQNQKFYNGDHWQDGDGWTGAKPISEHGNQSRPVQDSMADIKRSFVFRNVIKEIVDRHRNGVKGVALHWKLAHYDGPKSETSDLISEVESLLTRWIQEKKAERIFRKAVGVLLYGGRGPMRLRVPSGLVDENGRIPVMTFEDALNSIYFSSTDPVVSVVYTDPDTMKECSVFSYEKNGTGHAELSYLTNDGQTVLRTTEGFEARLDIGKRLLMHEMEREAIVTPSVCSLQKTTNLSLTMWQRNLNVAGFPERIYINAQTPGRYVEKKNGQREFIAEPLHVGAGITTVLHGKSYYNAEGDNTVLSPSVVFRDPVAIETFHGSHEAFRQAILEETHQLHYLQAADANSSGTSRVESRGAFESDLHTTKTEIDLAWSWMLEAAMHLAAYLSGEPGRYAALRAYSDCRINAGPVTPEEKRSIVEIYNQGLYSRERAMSLLGVPDVDAEMERIDREGKFEDDEQVAALQKQLAKKVTNKDPSENTEIDDEGEEGGNT